MKLQFHVRPTRALFPPGRLVQRRLDDYEFVWINWGRVAITYDDLTEPDAAGCVCLARPGMVDTAYADPSRPSHFAYFHFGLDFEPGELPAPATWPVIARLPDGDFIRPLFERLLWLSSARPPSCDRLLDLGAQEMLVSYVNRLFKSGMDYNLDIPAPIRRTLDWLASQWVTGSLTQPTVEELAAAASVSADHLLRLFRTTYAASPGALIRAARMEQAIGLLDSTDLLVREVATAVGFDNPFNFARLFHSRTGASPTAWREAHRDDPGRHSPAFMAWGIDAMTLHRAFVSLATRDRVAGWLTRGESESTVNMPDR